MKKPTDIFLSTQKAYQNWREPQYMRSLAQTYWHVIIGVSVFSVFCIIAYGMSSLRAIENETSSVAATATSTATSVDRAALSNTLHAFSTRAQRFDSLKAGTLQMGDPSR